MYYYYSEQNGRVVLCPVCKNTLKHLDIVRTSSGVYSDGVGRADPEVWIASSENLRLAKVLWLKTCGSSECSHAHYTLPAAPPLWILLSPLSWGMRLTELPVHNRINCLLSPPSSVCRSATRIWVFLVNWWLLIHPSDYIGYWPLRNKSFSRNN